MTNYYVRTDGSDSNNGLANTAGGAWRTINHAGSVAITGPAAIRVQPGTYTEEATISHGGSDANSWINYVADGPVLLQGRFYLTGVNYVRIVGFEITSVTAGAGNHTKAIMLVNCTHIDIIDNYIHDTEANCVWASGTPSTAQYITIRGNRLSRVGICDAIPAYNQTQAIQSSINNPNVDHWLVEYNLVEYTLDSFWVFGPYAFVRNNEIHSHYDPALWHSISDNHSDGFQCGSDSFNCYTRHHTYEANLIGDSMFGNSHGILQNDQSGTNPPFGDIDILVRGNVFYNIGSSGVNSLQTDYLQIINNTFYKIEQLDSTGAILIWRHTSQTHDPQNCVVANCLFHTSSGVPPIATNGNPNIIIAKTTNMGYLAGTDTAPNSFVSSATDPLLTDPVNYNFRLQSGSNARNAGSGLVVITTASGSGTSFDVDKPGLLRDGYGIVDGDIVTIGGTTTRISSISGNTVTVANSVSWTQNTTKVFWGNSSTIDIGGIPYAATPLTAATINNVGTTYTVSPTGDCRGVWFYQDGIPYQWVSSAPYSSTISSGVVTAKAYALYAQSAPVVTAVAGGGGPTAPTDVTSSIAGNRSVTVSWTESSGQTSYNIKRGLAGGSRSTIATAGQSDTSYVDKTVIAGVSYDYSVEAVNGIGTADSATATANVPAVSPISYSRGIMRTSC